ncbi:NEAT domain-containing protein [Blautia sp. MSJ-36]|uniref:NEAT domain-containing protein n=1 Tax=Blautia sp. MSJ-36 TaxID=2841530 RepID=UPI001C11405A|nr:NEAT domain-containing protein [Blautia sp. MSJ-36]MBU5447360.1 NEAT domain-containing protein [Blautia sp. MSJ-36]
MYVDAMGYAPDAFLQIDYAEKKESGDPSLNFTTEVSTAEVEQFGNYNVTSQVTVKDGRITDVALAGNDFKGTHADDNQMYLNKAINGLGSTKGMKEKLTGLYMNDAQKLNDLDTVTGATYSSNAIKNATMNALGVKIEQEVIPDAPSEKPAAGLYYIEMKDRTDVVDHGLVGESKKAGAYLRVDDAGKMWLTYKMVSGTTGEPLYVLGYNGYYPNGDISKALSMEGVTYSTEKMTAPTIGDCSVVTDITVPLDGISQTYVNNVSLYVEAMKNLNGEVSGVNFDHGKFNINSTITLYWDTLDNLSEGTNAAKLATLSDGVYKLNGQMVKVNKVDMSMSNNAFNHNVKLVMKDGLPYISMNFNSLTVGSLKGYLKDLNYYATGYTVSKTGEPSGTLLPVQVDSLQKFSNGKTLKDDFGTNYPNDVTFPLCQEAMTEENGEYVPMQVFVPIMDAITAGTGKQNVYLKLDYSTLKKTTADDKDFAETEKAPTDPSAIKAQTITVTVKNTKGVVSKKYGDKAFYLGAKAKTGLTYKSSNTKIATVDSKGKVTIKGVGTVKITITAKASTSYKAATKTITIKVAKATPVLKTKITSKAISYSALRKKSQVFTLGASTSSKGTLTYAKASGSSAFTVNRTNGKITVKKGLKKGTYKIKVKIYSKATTRYNAGSKIVLVTVKVK